MNEERGQRGYVEDVVSRVRGGLITQGKVHPTPTFKQGRIYSSWLSRSLGSGSRPIALPRPREYPCRRARWSAALQNGIAMGIPGLTPSPLLCCPKTFSPSDVRHRLKLFDEISETEGSMACCQR